MSNQYQSNVVDAYRRRLNTEKGIYYIKKAVHDSNRMAEFRNREKLKQEMARQRRLQMESDKRLKYNMQRIRKQERSMANSYAHIKKQNIPNYGESEKGRLTTKTFKIQDNQKQQKVFRSDNCKDLAQVTTMNKQKPTYVPSLSVSRAASKQYNTSKGRDSSYCGKTSLFVPTRETVDINLSFTRRVLQEMQNTVPKRNSKNELRYPYKNEPVISSNDSEKFGKFDKEEEIYNNRVSMTATQNYTHVDEVCELNRGKEYIYQNDVSEPMGQNFLVQASNEDPRWYQHIFVKTTNNGPIYLASNHYYHHPGLSDLLEPVYLLNNDPFPNFNPGFNLLLGRSFYQGTDEFNYKGSDSLPNLTKSNWRQPGYQNLNQSLEEMSCLNKEKYDMLVLNQDDKRVEQIRVQQHNLKNPSHTYDILSIEQSATPIRNALHEIIKKTNY